MKRTISFILALCLVLSLLPMGVLAAAPKVTFTVTADRSNAAVGDTITFTVSIGKVENLHGMLFELDIPEGLTYINGSAQVSNRLKSEFDFGEASFAEKTKIFVAATNSAVTLSGDTELMSFQCTVNGKASGALELGLSVEEEDVFDWEYCTIPFEIVSARVNVTKKADVVFTVSADRAKAVPGDTITYAVYISPVPDIHGVCFELDIPEGLSFVAGSSAVPENLMGQLNFGEASFAESTLVFVGVTNSETALTGETLLMSFQCKVDEGVLGQRTVGLKILEEDVFDIKYNNLPFATVAAAVQIHSHIWADATCTDPKTCSVCGETTGNALGHKWSNATCTDPKTCSVCGETSGNDLGHKWSDATCTDPKTCSVCGATTGSALGHKWTEATCTDPKTCSVCGETYGSALGHSWSAVTCTEPATCTICGTTSGSALGHRWADATCVNPKTCTICGTTDGEALGHDWLDATCTEPMICSVCHTIVGNALGHSFGETVVHVPTPGVQGYSEHTCTACGFNEKFDFVDFQGVTVSGKLDSYLGHGEVTIELIRDGEVVRTVVVNGAKEYSITDVEAGAYTLRVSKEKHAAMEYEITVGGENVSVDAKICPIGDVTGDGVVNIKDFQRLLRHVNKTNPLSGYELACGDVTGDGVCNIKDFQRLLRHVNKTNPLY